MAKEKTQELKSLSDAKKRRENVSQIIQKGAEANLVQGEGFVIKDRISKGYRYPVLDSAIRRRRTKREAKLLLKAGKFVATPTPTILPEFSYQIKMPFIDGLKLSENLDGLKEWKEVCKEIGEGIAKLHDEGIIHGDLTTSNLILVPREKKLYFIDFGLGFGNGRTEDKAVDLHLIKQALEAKHFEKFENYWKAILKGYEISKEYEKTMERFAKVEKRGRYKAQY